MEKRTGKGRTRVYMSKREKREGEGDAREKERNSQSTVPGINTPASCDHSSCHAPLLSPHTLSLSLSSFFTLLFPFPFPHSLSLSPSIYPPIFPLPFLSISNPPLLLSHRLRPHAIDALIPLRKRSNKGLRYVGEKVERKVERGGGDREMDVKRRHDYGTSKSMRGRGRKEEEGGGVEKRRWLVSEVVARVYT